MLIIRRKINVLLSVQFHGSKQMVVGTGSNALSFLVDTVSCE